MRDQKRDGNNAAPVKDLTSLQSGPKRGERVAVTTRPIGQQPCYGFLIVSKVRSKHLDQFCPPRRAEIVLTNRQILDARNPTIDGEPVYVYRFAEVEALYRRDRALEKIADKYSTEELEKIADEHFTRE